jgi:hypothetical protein
MSDDRWQLIKTAPKKLERAMLYGTLLTYCCCLTDRGKPLGETVAEGYRRHGRWWVGLYECKPTHWQPLPAPPG